MSMMEGGGDLTTNDYRVTVEKRGRSYPDPGAVTFRIISGDANHESGRVNDGFRTVVPMNDETWYSGSSPGATERPSKCGKAVRRAG